MNETRLIQIDAAAISHLPSGVESISIAHDTRSDGVHTVVFGYGKNDESHRCWVLSHTVVPLTANGRNRGFPGGGGGGAEIRGTKISSDEVDHDAWQEEDRPQTDVEAAAEYRSAQAENRAAAAEGERHEPLLATLGGVCFITCVGGRQIIRWVKGGAPVHSYRGREPVFDLVELATWMTTALRDREHGRRTHRGIVDILELEAPRRLIVSHIDRQRERAARAKTVPVTIMLGGEMLRAVANIDDIEALRRALPRLTTPQEDTL